MNYVKHNRMLAVFKALSNANRLKILQHINDSKSGELSVNEIFDKLEISQPAISAHLKLMRINKIVAAKQDSNMMHYSIADSFVLELIKQLQ